MDDTKDRPTSALGADDAAESSASPTPLAERTLALGLAALCLALSLVAIGQLLGWQKERAEMLSILHDAGIGAEWPSLLEDVRLESQPETARIATARILVYRALRLGADDLAPRADGAIPADDYVAELVLAEALARETLRVQPNHWQAQMLLGASIYLQRGLVRDRRLVTEASRWEEPLRAAIAAAPWQLEPRRVLAAAYLDVWPHLSPQKKESATELLRGVFADDPRAFQSMAPAWFSLHRDPDVAFSIVPPTPAAWAGLKRLFADHRSWTTFGVCHDRWLDALEQALEERFADAERRLRFGDLGRARGLFLGILLDAPPSERFADLASRALLAFPPGLHGHRGDARLRAWLSWALELDQVGRQKLPRSALARLVDALGSDLEPYVAAHAAMAAGDEYLAERFSRLVDAVHQNDAAPYQVARAAWLLEHGRAAEARDALQQVPGTARRGLAWAETRRAVARAVGDPAAEAAAVEQLDALYRTEHSAAAWRWLRGRPTLELATRDATGLELKISEAPTGGAVIEIWLDGRSIGRRVVQRGDIVPFPALRLEAGGHMLEVRVLAGGQVVPGSVRLLGGTGRVS